jgi:predicted DNA binding CopG/RHH family protein
MRRKNNKLTSIVDFDDFEKEIIDDFEKDKYESVENLPREKTKFKRLASEFIQKKANISIRISRQDILKIKRKSLETGIPYQTLISSVLHQFAQNKITIKA